MHGAPRDPDGGVSSYRRDVALRDLTDELDALCAKHDRAADRLHRLGRVDFERACAALRHFQHLRDIMRLRTFAARCGPSSSRSATRRGVLMGWPALLRASERLQRLARDPRPW